MRVCSSKRCICWQIIKQKIESLERQYFAELKLEKEELLFNKHRAKLTMKSRDMVLSPAEESPVYAGDIEDIKEILRERSEDILMQYSDNLIHDGPRRFGNFLKRQEKVTMMKIEKYLKHEIN